MKMKLNILLFFITLLFYTNLMMSFEPEVEYYSGNIENENLEKIQWKDLESLKNELTTNHIVYLRVKLPEKDLENYSLVYYSTEQFYEVYLDNFKQQNKIFEFHYGKLIPERLSLTTGEAFKIIRLKEIYAGKYLYFKIFYANKFSFLNHGKIMILPSDEVYTFLIRNYLPRLILISFFLISGILFIMVSFSRYVEKKTFLGAGVFITFIGIKQFSESILTSFLIPVPALWGYLAF